MLLSAAARHNAALLIGQYVELCSFRDAAISSRIVVTVATTCTLAAVDPDPIELSPALNCYLHSRLVGQHILVGHEFPVTLLGRRRVFYVASLQPLVRLPTTTSSTASTTTTSVFLVGQQTTLLIAEPDGEKTEVDNTGPATVVSAIPIGGLDEQIASVRQLLDVALHTPEVLESRGLRPPSGVLLHGPPGTGKTLIARYLAQECGSGVQFISIDGAEVVGKYVGESEERLRHIFEQAYALPGGKTLIFMDEIDALCPSRERSQSELHNRLVATLLTMLDGVPPVSDDSKNPVASDNGKVGRVFVIAATNRPHSLDEALRRPGRLDREIEVGVPTQPMREAILRAILRAVPHSLADGTDDINNATLGRLATKTHGFVGADLAMLVKEATMKSLRRRTARLAGATVTAAAPLQVEPRLEPQPQPEPSPKAEPGAWCVCEADLMESLVLVRPSSLREVALEIPSVKWEDIGGAVSMRQQMKEAVEWPLTHPEVFTRMGIRPPRGVLLFGPPGCSKTLTARALATESSLNFIAVKGPELFSKWVGDSEKAVAEVFRKARAAAPAIVFFDEIDALAVKRDGAGSVGDRVLTQLLVELDGAASTTRGGVVTIAATNRPDLLDPALVRPGRFDRQIYVAPPNASARLEILRIGMRGVPTAADVDLTTIAARAEGFSGAEAVALCREAAMATLVEAVQDAEAAQIAAPGIPAEEVGSWWAGIARCIVRLTCRSYLQGGDNVTVDPKTVQVAARHFETALTRVQPSITAAQNAFYEAYAAEQNT